MDMSLFQIKNELQMKHKNIDNEKISNIILLIYIKFETQMSTNKTYI